MSAYLCSPQHLSALANAPEQFARSYRLAQHTRDKIRQLDPLDDIYETSEWDDATFLFYALLRENMRSLNHRYPDTAGENWTERWDEWYKYSPRATFHETPDIRAAVRCLKALDCYEYQSCEHPGWHTSAVKDYCDSLRSYAISCLPGYDDAPWGYKAPEPRTKTA